MSDDLISREALKEAINTYDKFACLPNGKLEPFRNLEHSEMFEPYVHLRDIQNAIDNSPTVDFVFPTIKVNIPEETKQELIEELQKPHKLLVLPELWSRDEEGGKE